MQLWSQITLVAEEGLCNPTGCLPAAKGALLWWSGLSTVLTTDTLFSSFDKREDQLVLGLKRVLGKCGTMLRKERDGQMGKHLKFFNSCAVSSVYRYMDAQITCKDVPSVSLLVRSSCSGEETVL